jgi:hypothetical protein
MRVTANQALIVATGSSVDGTDATDPHGASGLDTAHAADAACAACHVTLDTTRSILAATWSWNYHEQVDPAWESKRGAFAFRDVVEPMRDVTDFGRVLARHPLVGPAWVQKLCHYANSAPCDEADPEFGRLVARFRDSAFATLGSRGTRSFARSTRRRSSPTPKREKARREAR